MAVWHIYGTLHNRRLPECQAALFLWNGLTALRNIVDVPVTTAEWGMAESHNLLSADGHSQQHPLPANRSDHHSNSPQLTTRASVRVVPWQVRDLKPHPSYARLGIKVPAARLNALLEMGQDAFLFPLIVTSDGIVIDGYARLEIARLQGRATVECLEYNISEEEALRRLLLCHRPSPGLAPFSRIAMARDLAKSLREKALQHQQAGGKNKGSSKLTEAEKVEVRKEICAFSYRYKPIEGSLSRLWNLTNDFLIRKSLFPRVRLLERIFVFPID